MCTHARNGGTFLLRVFVSLAIYLFYGVNSFQSFTLTPRRVHPPGLLPILQYTGRKGLRMQAADVIANFNGDYPSGAQEKFADAISFLSPEGSESSLEVRLGAGSLELEKGFSPSQL